MGPPHGSYGGRFDPDWHRGFSHENTNCPSGPPPLAPPAIPPKPQFPHGRVVDAYGCTVGYIPLSRGGTPNPPPEVP